MDEGLWIEVKKVYEVLQKLGRRECEFFDWFRFEEDAGKIRIHTVRAKLPIVEEFLKHFGRGIDLQELAGKTDTPLRLNSQMFTASELKCMCCYKQSYCLSFRPDSTVGNIQICESCLGEMLAYTEMEKEKRDSRAEEVRPKMRKESIDFHLFTNEGVIRNEGV